MRFSTVAIFGALAAIASAQNPFTRTSYAGIQAGQPEDITWEPTTQGTVTLVLMQGDPKALEVVQTIATSIVNDGKYTWTPDPSLVEGSDYALKIVDDLDPTAPPNYTTLFSIDSDVSESSSAVTSTTTRASTTETETSSVTETTTESSETSSASSTEVVTSTSTNTETTTTSGSSSSATSSSTRTFVSSSRTSAAPTSTTALAGAAPTGAKIGAGLVGFVGAAVLLL